MRGGDDAFGRFLDATARVRRYPYSERRDLWQARLNLNAPELARVRAFADIEEPPIQRPEPASAEVRLPAEAPVLRMAADMRAGAVGAASTAAGALRKAHASRTLNVFTHLDEAAGEMASGIARQGPLFGIPIAVKDLMAVRGLPMTGGTRALPPGVQKTDATAIGRLRAAGAVVLGMTNLHELAYGITNDNPHFGRVGNPCDPSRIAGGSSGGSAAAVALGIVPIAIGSDTAGSIRIPAACCGVVGLKPSYDLVPRDGAMALAWSLDHVGPLTANVADAAAALAIMAGAASAPSDSVRSRSGFRLVKPANFFFEFMEPSVRSCIEDVLALLSQAGFGIEERTVAGVEDAAAAQFATICSEATLANWHRLVDAPEGLGEDVRVRLEIGQFMTAVDYMAAQRYRTALRNGMMRALDGADAIVTPTIIAGAPEAGATGLELEGRVVPVHTAMTRCTAPFNLTGFPAITLPCGRDRDGLPLGLQLAGRPGDDSRLLEVALAVERHLAERGQGAG
jgi:Asp-tRNA(Asn)/Glu-tRNA(Gln) amidotransferase A subunit family amidase